MQLEKVYSNNTVGNSNKTENKVLYKIGDKLKAIKQLSIFNNNDNWEVINLFYNQYYEVKIISENKSISLKTTLENIGTYFIKE